MPAGTRYFSLLKNMQTDSGVHPTYCSVVTGRVPSLEVKRPWHEADHSPPYRAEVKNEWRSTSTLSISLHGMCRANITLIFIH